VDLSREGLLRQPESRGGVAEFGDDAGYRTAEVSYLAALRAALPGVALWANLTHDPEAVGGWESYLDWLDGVMVEDFAVGWAASPLGPQERVAQFENVRRALAAGKGVIAVEQAGAGGAAGGAENAAERTRLRYGLACYWALAPAGAPAGAPPPRRAGGLYFRYGD